MRSKHGDTYTQGWVERMAEALHHKGFKLGARNVTNTMLAHEVSKRLRLKPAVTPQAASRWVLGQSIPTADVVIALAAYLDVDPGWLLAGDASAAPGPMLPAKRLSVDLTSAAREHVSHRSASKAAHKTTSATKRAPRRR